MSQVNCSSNYVFSQVSMAKLYKLCNLLNLYSGPWELYIMHIQAVVQLRPSKLMS